MYADDSIMTCGACHEECNDSCSGLVSIKYIITRFCKRLQQKPTDCFGRCKNFALPAANNTIVCVSQCLLSTNDANTFHQSIISINSSSMARQISQDK